jgi:hypothetical protein
VLGVKYKIAQIINETYLLATLNDDNKYVVAAMLVLAVKYWIRSSGSQFKNSHDSYKKREICNYFLTYKYSGIFKITIFYNKKKYNYIFIFVFCRKKVICRGVIGALLLMNPYRS